MVGSLGCGWEPWQGWRKPRLGMVADPTPARAWPNPRLSPRGQKASWSGDAGDRAGGAPGDGRLGRDGVCDGGRSERHSRERRKEPPSISWREMMALGGVG